MIWTPQIQAFIYAHQDDDPAQLMLQAARYPDMDVRFAAEQIAARKQIRTKLPEWYALSALIMGGRIPAEQCSSQQTAEYKKRLVVGDSLADMTGGMGVDLYYMSRGLQKAIYVERQSHLCEAAQHNFEALGADNIEVVEGDALSVAPSADTIYLDPARRAQNGSRVYDLEDCEPNVVALRDELLARCRRLVVKISPMADLKRVLRQVPGISEVHVVAVKGECKELLLVLNSADKQGADGDVKIFCVDYKNEGMTEFSFSLEEEEGTVSLFADSLCRYLYEPNVAIMKGGAFRCVGNRHELKKIEVNSHLYTSDVLHEEFPGRIFEVEEVLPFSSKCLKTLKRSIPKANITTRNFPLTADALRAKAGVKDGGDIYLFATTLKGGEPCLLRCHKVTLTK